MYAVFCAIWRTQVTELCQTISDRFGEVSDLLGWSGVKLKLFQLKKFDGNFENWLPFRELFKRAVHENKQLSVTAKYKFSSESLIVRPEATIPGFKPIGKCHNEAIQLLLDGYGNTEKAAGKFVRKLMSSKPSDEKTNNELENLTANELQEAEINALKENKKFLSDFKLSSLEPVINKGLEFYTHIRNPNILLKKSYLSQLIALDAHSKTRHGGTSTLSAFIQANAKRILQYCVVCLCLHGKSAMGPRTVLSSERVATARPFETTGVDFVDLLYIATEDSKTNEKVSEHVIISPISRHFPQFRLLNDWQTGCRRLCSTSSTLLGITESISGDLNEIG
uniref:Uncharacterized protein n=1 Tax=Glossina austeni TaxID=7395 RepID=A0A1A9V307_GLOAU